MVGKKALPFDLEDAEGDFDSVLTDDAVTDIGGENGRPNEIREAPPAPVKAAAASHQVPARKVRKPAVQPAGKTAALSAARKVSKATVKTATKKAAAPKKAVKKAAPKKAAPKKAAPKKAAPKKAAPKKAAPKKAAPKKAAKKK
ncbi:MAG: hypothetical protein KJZ84_09120 [Bryobacteraceae bacterium]|nr:hypothetical protein [Bryobacteraceae bacterium]